MLKFFQAVKYIVSLDRFEYRALKIDARKTKNKLLIIISNVIVLAIIAFFIFQEFFIATWFIISLIFFSFFQYYWKLYQVLKDQLGNPFTQIEIRKSKK